MKSSHYLLLAVAALGLALVGWLLLPGDQPATPNGSGRPRARGDAVAPNIASAAGGATAAPSAAPSEQPENSVPGASASAAAQARPPLEPNPAAGPAAQPRATDTPARASDPWRGRILDRTTGDPVVAGVEQHSSSGSDRTTSDERSYFELPWPELGPANLTIQASGYATAHWPALTNPPQDNLWLDAFGECEVFASDKQLLGDEVLLELWKLTGEPLEAGRGRQVMAQANQPASVGGLEPGLYIVSAQRVLPPAEGRVPAEQGRAWLSGVRIESHRQTRAELELPPLIKLDFRFDLGMQDSNPLWLRLERVSAPLTAQLPQASLATELFLVGNEKGLKYSTPKPIEVFPGPMRASVLTDWGSCEHFEVTADGVGNAPLERLTSPASLTGTVLDAEKRPLLAMIGVVRADALHELATFSKKMQLLLDGGKPQSVPHEEEEGHPPSPVQWTMSNKAGHYRFSRVAATVPLVVLAWPLERSGYVGAGKVEQGSGGASAPWPQVKSLGALEPRAEASLGFQLLPGRLLQVSAALPDGTPAVGAEVQPSLLGWTAHLGSPSRSGRTFALTQALPLMSTTLNTAGNGTLWLPPDAVEIAFQLPGALPQVRALPLADQTNAEQAASLHVVFKPSQTQSGHVVDLTGTAIDWALVTLRMNGDVRSLRTDSKGQYSFTDLSAGSASLEASGWMLHAGPAARCAVQVGHGTSPNLVLNRLPLPRLRSLRGAVGSDDSRAHAPGLWFQGAGSQAVVSYSEQGFLLSGMDPQIELLTVGAPWHAPIEFTREALDFTGEFTLERFQLTSLARLSLWPCGKHERWQWRSALDSPPEGVLSAFPGDDLEPRGDLMFAFAPKLPCILERSSPGFSTEVDLSVPGEQDSLKEVASSNTSAGAAKTVQLNLRIQH